MCFSLIIFVQFEEFCYWLLPTSSLITNIMLLGEHRPLHQRCDSEEPGGSFSLHLRAGSEPDLHPDGERLLRSVPAVWAVPGTPQVNWLVQLQGDSALWSQIHIILLKLTVFNIHFWHSLNSLNNTTVVYLVKVENTRHSCNVSLQLTELAHC